MTIPPQLKQKAPAKITEAFDLHFKRVLGLSRPNRLWITGLYNGLVK